MFNKKLRSYRMLLGMTQREMAEHLGIQIRSYQNYEQGIREPNFDTLIKIADLFSLSLDELFDRTPPK